MWQHSRSELNSHKRALQESCKQYPLVHLSSKRDKDSYNSGCSFYPLLLDPCTIQREKKFTHRILDSNWICHFGKPVLLRLQHGQHQLFSFLIKRGKTNSCFCCSPCFSQQFAVPALCYPSEVEWCLQRLPLHSVPLHGLLENGNAYRSRLSSIPLVLKPIKMKSELERYDICSPSTLPREKARLLFGCCYCGGVVVVAFLNQKALVAI